MQQLIKNLLQQALQVCAAQQNFIIPEDLQISLDRPRDPNHGDFATNLALLLAKKIGMSPQKLASLIINNFPKNEHIIDLTCAGPGFINFTLSNHYLTAQFETIWHSSCCGIEKSLNPETIVVDYSSPNLAKEMHIGHLRSTIIGDAIANILEFQGHHVIRQNHVGDWGTQFGMLLAHLETIPDHNLLTSALQDLESFYTIAKKRFDLEPHFAERARQLVVKLQSNESECLKLWTNFIELSLQHCQEVYERLGVTLERRDIRAESAYNDLLPKIIKILHDKKLLVTESGAQC